MEKLRVGVIGVGGIAQTAHIPSYKKNPAAELVAAADPNREKLSFVGKKFGIPKLFADPADLLREDLDAVSICCPNAYHAPLAVAALRSGKSVLCEKPICLKASDVGKIYGAARAAKRTFMAAFPRRFSGEAKVLRALIANGDFGDIYYVKTGYLRRRGIPGLGTWFTDKSLAGGGPMMDIGVHALDFVIHLLGAPKPEAVIGTAYNAFADKAVDGGWPPRETRVADRTDGPFDVEDLAAGFVRFAGGATLFVEASWAANIGPASHTTILGTKAGAALPDPDDPAKPVKVFSECGGILTDMTPAIPRSEVFQEEIDHFVDCVRNRRQPITTEAEVLATVTIIENIYKSAASGRPVLLK